MSDESTALERDIDDAMERLLKSELFRNALDYWQDAEEDPDRRRMVKTMIRLAVMKVLEKPH